MVLLSQNLNGPTIPMKPSVAFASMLWVLRERAGSREVGHKSFGLWRSKGGIWEVVITAWDSELYLAGHKASRIRTVSKPAVACSGTKNIESSRKYL